jgi:hypothetical protein
MRFALRTSANTASRLISWSMIRWLGNIYSASTVLSCELSAV